MAILIFSAVNYEHIAEHKDNEGRFVMITGKIEGTVMRLLNVYVPPGSNWSFYKRRLDLMVTKSQGFAGDFNIRLNSKLDSSNGKSDAKNISKRFNTWKHEVGVVNVWKEINPTSREYTHCSYAHNVYSRIDYFLYA